MLNIKDRKFKLRIDSISIELSDDVSEGECFDALKCGENPPIRYKILVKKRGLILGQYIKKFEIEPNLRYFNNFMKKFLRDPAYREKFQLGDDEWNEVIEWDDPVNPSTRRHIAHLNRKKMKNMKSKDFARLKVGGFDSFSRLKSDKLNSIISDKDRAIIEAELDEENLILQAKRWVARGLDVRKSIRKVKTDQTIRNNIRK